jgi:hypothetical protein
VKDLRDRRPLSGRAKILMDDEDFPHPLFDHAEFFTQGRRPAAIVAHVYDDEVIEDATAFARQHGIAVQQPPQALASWYYPGQTTLLCYTRANTRVNWLPEQLVKE